MDKQSKESNTINTIDLEILKNRLLTPDFVSLFQRVSNILRSSVAVHVWDLNTAQNFLVWSDRGFPLCSSVLSGQVGSKKCFIDRYRYAEQATFLEIPLFYKCHVGFSCASIYLTHHHYYSVVLTIGPFNIEEMVDVLYYNVVSNLKELKFHVPKDEKESLKSLPYHSVDSVREVALWMKESFQSKWSCLFQEKTDQQLETNNRKYQEEKRDENSRDINQYLEKMDKLRKQMLFIGIEMGNKKFVEFILKGKAEELSILGNNVKGAKFSLYTWIINALSSVFLEGLEQGTISRQKLFMIKEKLFFEDKTLKVFIRNLTKCIFSSIDSSFKKENQKKRFDIFLSTLEKTLMSNCTLVSITEEMQMEPSTLSHWIKRNIGINYDELLNYIQVEKIAEFLRNTDKNLSEIGNCVGIKNDSYVSKKFRETTGFYPTEYKVHFMSKRIGYKKEL